MHSSVVCSGLTYITSGVMMSRTGVSLDDRGLSVTFRAQSRSLMMPTTCMRSMTSSAPMFLSAINWTASNTEAVGAIVKTVWSSFDLRRLEAVFMEDLRRTAARW